MTHSAEKSNIAVIAQGEGWLAVEKPSGLSVHNQEDPINLLSILNKQLGSLTFYPVHRLDKETSGIQLLATSEKMASELSQQFQNRQVQKFYQGVVAGQLPPQGVWDQPLTDKGEGFKNPAGLAKDRIPCETRFRKIKESKYFSWLEFQIITGRQHQIRKHCALNGRALIGDPRYGNPKYNQKINEIYHFRRMALHCSRMLLADGTEIKSESIPEFENLFKD